MKGQTAARDAFSREWSALKDDVASGRLASPKSPLWETLIRDFRQEGSAGPVSGARGARGYGFVPLEDETAGLRLSKLLLWGTFASAAALQRAARSAWKVNLAGAGHDHLLGYPCPRRALRLLKLEDDYLALCAELGISPDSMSTAKAYYLARRLADFAPRADGGLRVLEVGGGTGNLAVFLSRLRPIGRYAIVDLPEMLLHSSMNLHRFFPDAPASFLTEDGPVAGSGYLFVPSVRAARLPAGAFDVCVCVDAMQEMTREQVVGYLELFQRCARPGGVVMTLNRRKQVGDYDNNPLQYPYGPNEILEWETDAFMHHAFRSERKDGFMLRVERKRA